MAATEAAEKGCFSPWNFPPKLKEVGKAVGVTQPDVDEIISIVNTPHNHEHIE